MKYKLILLSLVASVLAEPALELKPCRYHLDVGIPLAERIRQTEEQLSDRASYDSNKIIGGVISQPNSHPYLGALIITFWNNPGSSVCGSSLLTANRAVTAAHCWSNRGLLSREFTVVLGSNFLFSGGTRIPTSNVIVHPQWNDINLNNDVAMIYLPYNAPISVSIQPIAIASPFPWAETYVGDWAMAAGFGTVSDAQQAASTVMSEVNLQVISNLQCQMSYGTDFVVHSTLCTSGAGFVGLCGGDSGGPLVTVRNGQRILIGIASFAAHNACQQGHPSGFARVTSFYSFITSHL